MPCGVRTWMILPLSSGLLSFAALVSRAPLGSQAFIPATCQLATSLFLTWAKRWWVSQAGTVFAHHGGETGGFGLTLVVVQNFLALNLGPVGRLPKYLPPQCSPMSTPETYSSSKDRFTCERLQVSLGWLDIRTNARIHTTGSMCPEIVGISLPLQESG